MRRALRAAVEQQPTWTVCAEATTALRIPGETIEFGPEVVLDTEAAGFRQRRGFPRASSRGSGLEVLIVSVFESTELAAEFREAGPTATCSSPMPASRGRRRWHSAQRRHLLQRPLETVVADLGGDRKPPPEPWARLTTREREVLQLAEEVEIRKVALFLRNQSQDRGNPPGPDYE